MFEVYSSVISMMSSEDSMLIHINYGMFLGSHISTFFLSQKMRVRISIFSLLSLFYFARSFLFEVKKINFFIILFFGCLKTGAVYLRFFVFTEISCLKKEQKKNFKFLWSFFPLPYPSLKAALFWIINLPRVFLN